MSGIARRLARSLSFRRERVASAVAVRNLRRGGPNRAAGPPAKGGRDHDAVVEELRRAHSLPDALVAQVAS
jgi:hypothetical protein